MPRRTAIQQKCDQIDLLIYRVLSELDHVSSVNGISKDVASDLSRAAGNIRFARVYVRKHMHTADRAITA